MSEVIKPEDILTPEELRARLKVTLAWVYEKTRRRGRITKTPMPVLRAGHLLRFHWPSVCQWMQANEVPKHTA
jgi:hypothetical protein